MARIPEAEIERLKSEVSLARLVEAKGIVLARHGADLVGRCPFHEDRTPSLVVSPKKNLWHCLGACQAGGSVIDWVMKTEGVSFRHAVELLREGAPSLAAGRIVRQSTVPKLAAPVALGADDRALLAQVIDYYHATLKTSPEALGYLQRRGLVHPELVDRFRLGFANRTLGLRLPEKNRKAGAVMRERLQAIGILRDSGHEHFNGCLVVPITDEAGNVTEVYGRKITEGLRPGTPLHLYLPGPHRGVWNETALAEHKEIILCEALVDALTFWCAGYRNVTAAYGIEGFTDDHVAAFRQYGTKRVLIAYDRDDAGERGAEKLAPRLMAEGLECWRIQFPKGMDANAYALKVTPAVKSLGVAIRKAVWLGKGREPPRAEIAMVDPSPATSIVATALLARDHAPAASSLAADLAAKEKTSPPPGEMEATDATLAPAATDELTSPPASPVPAAAPVEAPAEVKANEIVLTFGDRHYRVRGLQKNTSYEILKVNLLAARAERFHVDTVDLRNAKQKAAYTAQAALELQLNDDVVKTDLARLFFKLEALRDEAIARALEPKAPLAVTMAEPERAAALAFLQAPRLIERIHADLTACGLIGETVNKVVAYLAATSRKLEQPLAVLVQSSSAAGKSSLMDAVLALMPEEERIKYSAVTGQSLFYLGGEDLKHKILAIVEEEGASRATYALKLLQSEGELTIASTGKDPETGELKAQTYRVEGPVALFSTTTAADIDPELQNRCLVLAIDEERAQTQAIHRAQRERRTLEGLIARAERDELRVLHRNAQRLLRPLAVLNPYAPVLTFPDTATRLRRDHEKYLTLIDVIALVHQYQREVKTMNRRGKLIEYVEATLDDVALANELAHEVLGRSLDELPPQTRRVLVLLDRFVADRADKQAIERAQVRFSRRELREATAIGDTQLRLHLDRLVALEYLLVHRGARGASFVYELVYDGGGQDGRPFVPGLIDVEALRATATTANLAGGKGEFAGQNVNLAGSTRGQRGPNAGGSRGCEIAVTPHGTSVSDESAAETAQTQFLGGDAEKRSSYAQDEVVPLAAARRA